MVSLPIPGNMPYINTVYHAITVPLHDDYSRPSSNLDRGNLGQSGINWRTGDIERGLLGRAFSLYPDSNAYPYGLSASLTSSQTSGTGILIKYGEYGVGQGIGPGEITDVAIESLYRKGALVTIAFAGIFNFAQSGSIITAGRYVRTDSRGRWISVSQQAKTGFLAVTGTTGGAQNFVVVAK